jgi:hypothetical protein
MCELNERHSLGLERGTAHPEHCERGGGLDERSNHIGGCNTKANLLTVYDSAYACEDAHYTHEHKVKTPRVCPRRNIFESHFSMMRREKK